MKKLIMNADDFGLHKTVNLGIIQGYASGFITSTTIMPNGAAFEHAVGLAMSNPQLGIGIHLTLVGESPVCPPEHVKTLVDKDGRLPPQYPTFLLQYMLGHIRLSDVRRELTAQVQKVVDCGLQVTHLDSHQHLHILPGIIEIIIDIAKDFGIKAIRIPREPYFFIGGYPFSLMRFISRGGLSCLSQLASRKIKNNQLHTSDHFFGMLAGCNMQEKYLYPILKALPDGISEIMIHPGTDDDIVNRTYNWNLHGQEELKAVTSKRIGQLLQDQKIQLISFQGIVNE